jgi:hypothetical protein
MRFTNTLVGNFSMHTICAGLLTLSTTAGCEPGYMLETESVCTRLKTVNASENVAGWAMNEIQSHLPAATNRPASFSFTDMPHWVKNVYRDYTPTPYGISYGLDPADDHVSIDWMTGRGCWGVLLGGPKYVPGTNLPDKLFYVVKCDPGLYAWHSRSDY